MSILSKPVITAQESSPASELNRGSLQATASAFVVLFCIVGMALWGLPFYYDFVVRQFGWTRAQVTSGNALSKLAIGPCLGSLPAGWLIALGHAAWCWREF